MKSIFPRILPALFFLVLLPVSASRAQTLYLTSLPDIPLMAGMQEITDSGVVFDKAEGKIVEESARVSGINRDQVENFYAETLPALGWKKESPQRFRRNGEQLIVNVEKLQSEGLVRFAVSPSQP